MKVIIALGLLFAVVALATFLVGASLPATRRGAVTRTLEAEPELIRSTMLDAANQHRWRAAVASVEQPTNAGWTEVTRNGEHVVFRVVQNTDAALNLTFESSRGYVGRFAADMVPTASGATLTVREEATTSSPIGHIGSRLFFDPEAFAAAWLDELAREVARRRAQRGDA